MLINIERANPLKCFSARWTVGLRMLSGRHLEHAFIFYRLCKWWAEMNQTVRLKHSGHSKADFPPLPLSIALILLCLLLNLFIFFPVSLFASYVLSSSWSSFCTFSLFPSYTFSHSLLSPLFYLKETNASDKYQIALPSSLSVSTAHYLLSETSLLTLRIFWATAVS